MSDEKNDWLLRKLREPSEPKLLIATHKINFKVEIEYQEINKDYGLRLIVKGQENDAKSTEERYRERLRKRNTDPNSLTGNWFQTTVSRNVEVTDLQNQLEDSENVFSDFGRMITDYMQANIESAVKNSVNLLFYESFDRHRHPYKRITIENLQRFFRYQLKKRLNYKDGRKPDAANPDNKREFALRFLTAFEEIEKDGKKLNKAEFGRRLFPTNGNQAQELKRQLKKYEFEFDELINLCKEYLEQKPNKK